MSRPQPSLPEEPTYLRSGDAALECWIVPWDSEVFGFPVAQIGRIDVADGSGSGRLMDALEQWCAHRDVALVSCRLDHSRLRESMTLEDRGFRFIETTLTPTIDLRERVDPPKRPVLVRPATENDLGEVAAIAGSAFSTGRFLMDWRLDPALSGARYASWVRRSAVSGSQAVLTAIADDRLIGFFIVERTREGGMYWHLTAIAPDSQGRGLGMALWQTMLDRHRAEGATTVSTTISGHNLAAINLYARLGFTFASTEMTFHWLRRSAQA